VDGHRPKRSRSRAYACDVRLVRDPARSNIRPREEETTPHDRVAAGVVPGIKTLAPSRPRSYGYPCTPSGLDNIRPRTAADPGLRLRGRGASGRQRDPARVHHLWRAECGQAEEETTPRDPFAVGGPGSSTPCATADLYRYARARDSSPLSAPRSSETAWSPAASAFPAGGDVSSLYRVGCVAAFRDLSARCPRDVMLRTGLLMRTGGKRPPAEFRLQARRTSCAVRMPQSAGSNFSTLAGTSRWATMGLGRVRFAARTLEPAIPLLGWMERCITLGASRMLRALQVNTTSGLNLGGRSRPSRPPWGGRGGWS
jgi:hypothetical protein